MESLIQDLKQETLNNDPNLEEMIQQFKLDTNATTAATSTPIIPEPGAKLKKYYLGKQCRQIK